MSVPGASIDPYRLGPPPEGKTAMELLDTAVNGVMLAAIGILLGAQTRRLEREMNRRFDEVDRRFEQVDRRFGGSGPAWMRCARI